MIKELEIEFKTEITEKTYNLLITKFDLKKKVYKLTNYYFETVNNSLDKTNKTLRIREENNTFTLTLKSKVKSGILEKHITLDETKANKMINEGFNMYEYFNIDINVVPYGKLTTYRCSTPYKDGILFFDKFTYYDITKYEIEYEVTDYDNGLKTFKEFLNAEKIAYLETIKKSRRVFKHLKKHP